MKKTKRFFAGITALSLVSVISAGMNANAIVDIRSNRDAKELLAGYEKIEDASAIEWQEYQQELHGTSYYVNERGGVIALNPSSDHIDIEVNRNYDESRFAEIVSGICSEHYILQKDAPETFETVNISIYAKLGVVITESQARELFNALSETVELFGYKYNFGYFNIGCPSYYFKKSKDSAGAVDFTVYKGIENADVIQKFIEESGIECHIELIERLDTVDVVPDMELSYLEEIALAAKIYNGTGLKICSGVIPDSADSPFISNSIDMYNAVEGDSNCDNSLNLADAVFILQSISNPDGYKITPQGIYNADTDGNGITTADALNIQRNLLYIK